MVTVTCSQLSHGTENEINKRPPHSLQQGTATTPRQGPHGIFGSEGHMVSVRTTNICKWTIKCVPKPWEWVAGADLHLCCIYNVKAVRGDGPMNRRGRVSIKLYV